MRKGFRCPGRSRGQSLVETALTLPVVLLLALGVTDLGRSFYYREAVTNSARQALRMAVSSYEQGTANSVCAGTGGGPVAVSVSSIMPAGGTLATIANQAALESSTNGTPAGSVIAGATITVTFHCLNGSAVTNATGNGNGPADPGSDSITASITYRMSVLTPVMATLAGPSVPIGITTSQRVEY